MSKSITSASDIVARLLEAGAEEAASPLHGVPVLLWRQQDLQTAIDEALAKMSLVVLVFPTGNRRADVLQGEPFLSTHTVQIIATPLLQTEGAPAADDAAEAVARALDGWLPPSAPMRHPDYQMTVESFELVPDDDNLIWLVAARTKIFL